MVGAVVLLGTPKEFKETMKERKDKRRETKIARFLTARLEL